MDVRDTIQFQHVERSATERRAGSLDTYVDGPPNALKHVIGSKSQGDRMTILAVQRVCKVAGFAHDGVYVDIHIK